MNISKLAAATLWVGLMSVPMLQADDIKAIRFSGQAIVADLTNGPPELPNLPIGNTGPLPSEGCCTLTVEVPEIDIPGIISLKSAKASTAATTDDESKSKVKIKKFVLPFTTADGATHTLSFKSLEVEAGAECHDDGVDLKTEFDLEDLKLDDTKIHVTKEANQTVTFAGGSLILNSQSVATTIDSGEITVVGIILLVDGGLSGPIGFAHADVTCEPRVTFSGEASVADLANALPGGIPLPIGKTGPLPPEGCDFEVKLSDIDIPGIVSLESAKARAIGIGDEAKSCVKIKEFSIPFTTADQVTHTLSFESLEIKVEAECKRGGPTVDAKLDIEGLRFDGTKISISDAPNQVFTFPGGSLTFNTLAVSTTPNSADITASAIFIMVDGGLSGPIGFVHADVTCPTPAP